MVVVTSAIGRKTTKENLQRGPRRILRLNSFVQESVSGVRWPNRWLSRQMRFGLLKRLIKWSFQRIWLQQLQCFCLIRPYSFCRSLLSSSDALLQRLFVQEGSLTVGQIVAFITYLNNSSGPFKLWTVVCMWSGAAGVLYDSVLVHMIPDSSINHQSQHHL